jgi:Flp pilus assembly protein TadG
VTPGERVGRLRRPRGDAGISTVEFVLMAPLLLLFSIFLVGLGLVVRSHSSLDAAARDAARAASQQRTVGEAQAAAQTAADASGGPFCVGGRVTVDGLSASQFVSGGIVTVKVHCEVPALKTLGFHWNTRVDATSAAPIDVYRRTG